MLHITINLFNIWFFYVIKNNLSFLYLSEKTYKISIWKSLIISNGRERGMLPPTSSLTLCLKKWVQHDTKTSNNIQDKVGLNSKWFVTLIYVLTFRIPKLLFSKIMPHNVTFDILLFPNINILKNIFIFSLFSLVSKTQALMCLCIWICISLFYSV